MTKQDSNERRVNQEIKAPEVRVVDSNGEQLGIMKVSEALAKAREEKLDLVEMAPGAKPPVCKIVDYNKFLYAEKKKAKEVAKKNRDARIEVKELWLRPVTEKHDMEVKIRHARTFLSEGNKVKFIVKFRGREISHTQQGQTILQEVLNVFGETVKIDAPITQAGRQMTLTLAPLPKVK